MEAMAETEFETVNYDFTPSEAESVGLILNQNDRLNEQLAFFLGHVIRDRQLRGEFSVRPDRKGLTGRVLKT
jgi:hypothetical protein